MEREELAKRTAELLSSFLDVFTQYSDEVFGERDQGTLDDLRTKLQRMEPEVTRYLIEITGDGATTISSIRQASTIEHKKLLPSALLGGNNEMTHNFYGYKGPVIGLLNRALGAIEAGLWPPKEPSPVLVISDEELRERCTDLLAAPGNYDRVIREATTVLENRIREKATHEVLAELIPNAAEQKGENLINRLFNPDKPIISTSTEKTNRIALYKMLIGVFAYLRNPYHHEIDSTTEWSWAWSCVGFIDDLLNVIENCALTK